MGFPKGASIPVGQGRDQNPAREVAPFIDMAVAIQIILKFTRGAHVAPRLKARRHSRGTDIGRPIRVAKVSLY